ncbi:hypothetical protein AWB80_01160 [Caballeronia pedi]|uniref:Uncharacterized protein n=1 Tax=Caballeronia pedi TaxID=1777141 RepID=A0A157ZR01_9BURK|nr:hypothetical protein [Caballeronia pedi]SAK47916.1 hypothetical protein AWB80_01160 [Caballeronia pedi]
MVGGTHKTEGFVVERSATLKASTSEVQSRRLSDWEHLDAYVLLAEPGAGKTTAFKAEAERMGDSALYVTARNFAVLGLPPGVAGKTLFIDSLDEHRTDSVSPYAALDEIRRALQNAGRPRFRLSCREADWLGGGDVDLQEVSPSEEVKTLWLNPLNEVEILELLRNLPSSEVADPALFLEEAQARKLAPLLSNPLLLKLLVDVVQKGNWPDSRSATYAAACKLLVQEHNPVHQRSRSNLNSVSAQGLLSTAGKLAAVMLLSNSSAIQVRGSGITTQNSFHIDDLPSDLNVDKAVATAALDTKLFAADGDFRVPVHRTVGEYLAGHAVGELVSRHGLPLQRVLAIMTVAGSQTVDVLRGVYAWMALFCVDDRELLARRDPLGLILYGDVKPFSVGQKVKLLMSLARVATENPWFRNENWEAHPFGALGTADMESTFDRLLNDGSGELGHEALAICILDAIRYGETFPGLGDTFEKMARDESRHQRVRVGAVAAWLRNDAFEMTAAQNLLRDLRSDAVKDEDDEVLGEILNCLYPRHLTVQDVLAYCRPPKQPNLIGQFRMFWAAEFNRRLPDEDLPAALDVLQALLGTAAARDDIDTPTRVYDIVREVAARVLVRAVDVKGESVCPSQLWKWFSLGLDKYGSAGLESSAIKFMSDWLSARPEMQRLLVLENLEQMSTGAISYEIHSIEKCLYHAERPADWYRWLLEQAAASSDKKFVESCVDRAAFIAVNFTGQFDIRLETLENWIEANRKRWPQAEEWVQRNTAWPLDSWQKRQSEQKQKVESRRRDQRALRQSELGPRVRSLLQGAQDIGLVQAIAYAHEKIHDDHQGETPLERVADLLVVDDTVAERAIEAMKRIVDAENLPSLANIVSGGRRVGYGYPASFPALLAAKLCFFDGADVTSWRQSVVEALLGFYMIDSGSPLPGWLRALAESKPDQVSDLMFTCWEEQLKDGRVPNVEALRFLRENNAPRDLVSKLLPRVIGVMPAEPDERLLHLFSNVFLPGAERHLKKDTVSQVLTTLLSKPGLSDKFRLAIRTGLFVNDPVSQIQHIENEAAMRAGGPYLLAMAIEQRGQSAYDALAGHPAIAARLIRVLASTPTVRTPADDESYNSPYDHQGAVLRRIAHFLAESMSPVASQELDTLRRDPKMEPWCTWLAALFFQQDSSIKNRHYVPPTPEAVANVLANKQPANPRDMAELLRDQLIQVGNKIHFEETNQLDLFYDRDKKGVFIPKSENACRDVLLGLLRIPLALRSVQIEKESLAAADKRADMQTSIVVQGGRKIVPVEIKKDNHPELWHAWRDQLEPRYMRNPDAESIGVFIILWFGQATKVGPDKEKPKSAKEMAEMVSALMPAEYDGHIVGLVLDLSRSLSRK